MPTLDTLVTDALLARVLAPARVADLMREVRQGEWEAEGGLIGQLREVTARERECTVGIERLLRAVEEGLATEKVRERIRSLETALEEAREDKRNLERRAATSGKLITSFEIARAVAYLEDLLRNGDLELRKAYLRLFIERVQVNGDEIVITGSREVAAKAVEATAHNPTNTVPVYMRDWRAVGDETGHHWRCLCRIKVRGRVPNI